MNAGALAGLKVVDISTIVAGGMASSMLADHGADVLKIEDPRAGDPARTLNPLKDGISLWHRVSGRNKTALSLNLGKPEGAEILLRLVKDADILIENFRPGTLEKWGLGWDKLKAANPKLVLLRISGFGQDGPYSNRPGFGTVAEGLSGLAMRTGPANGAPALASLPLADNITGLFGAFAVMFAIYNRDHGNGRGQMIDISLYEPLFRILEDQVLSFDQLGRIPQRMGNRLPGAAPRGAFETSDGRWIAIAVSSEKTAQRLLIAVGGEGLANDPRFNTNAERFRNADALEAIIADWIGAREADDVLGIFERGDVVAIELFDIAQIFQDPHVLARGNIIDVEDPTLGNARVPGVVPKFSETPGEVRHLSRPLGSDNDEVYRATLGFTAEQISALRANGVI
ncbi:CoA transferase [Sphingomonas sp. CGMCC 1.13654]|uniref:CoA transferase n=1 Tax=Sphingomonas chungangi TaxID=2683589 RepID=A0A838L619_9SPHN|nr:CaiB/BaiF CoA-transferase family protein [Sphingomonas chungangi]MBA2933028.1 CoA transferase [Sphingomonas chungangi]MVW56648.1 CoA transferase [Sphingomonas chungangi]